METVMTIQQIKARDASDWTEPLADESLAAQIEPFDSFWEGPEDVEKGYRQFYEFYRRNYLKYLPVERNARILVISCGPGYFVNLLVDQGYRSVIGIDSYGSKVASAVRRNLDCRQQRAFAFLAANKEAFEVIICEQELNHLTKQEMLHFLRMVWESLTPDGTLIVHALNGANPITGAEALAQNFDHHNTMTEYSLRQVLDHSGFERTQVFPLHLYVFYKNPANYLAWGITAFLSLLFRACFVLYGKSNRLFTKKIGACCRKPA